MRMIRRIVFLVCLIFFSVTLSWAAEKKAEVEAKVISGMSIVGNNETPKALYIVPWKNSDGKRTVNFSFSNLNEDLKPVDKSDFIRELDLYRISNPN